MRDVRPIFVVGAPRSGTTLIGAWLGSDPETFDTGEYGALYLAHHTVPERLRGFPSAEFAPHRGRYIAEVQAHAERFVSDLAREHDCTAFTDSTPMNLAIADVLAERFPDALFVLAVRHYVGVIQSLGRTGWRWVPASVAGRAAIWADAYAAVPRLPVERTVALSYDGLCADPAEQLGALRARLAEHGVRTDRLDDTVLGTSHANYGPVLRPQDRPTIRDASGRLAPMPSADVIAWRPAHEQAVAAVVRPVEALLRATPGVDYRTPAGLRAET